MTEQGFQNFDPSTAKLFNFIMDKNLAIMTEVVRRCYTDTELLRDYEALRQSYSVDQLIGKASQRELLRIPHPYVERFIDAEMSKKYGPKWKEDKMQFRKILKKEPLLEPWLVVPKHKI